MSFPLYADYEAPLVVSISAPTAEGFASLAAELSIPGVAAIEANISCPNIEEDGKAFAMSPQSTENVTRQLRAATDLPLWVKLTPNIGNIADVARAAEACGADAAVVANTILSMAINLKIFRPSLGNVMGGLSGPAQLLIVLRQVFQCARAINIPVIGCAGGISTAEDAVEYLWLAPPPFRWAPPVSSSLAAMTTIIDDLKAFCIQREISRVSDLIGAVVVEEADEVDLSWGGSGPMTNTASTRITDPDSAQIDRALAQSLLDALRELSFDVRSR